MLTITITIATDKDNPLTEREKRIIGWIVDETEPVSVKEFAQVPVETEPTAPEPVSPAPEPDAPQDDSSDVEATLEVAVARATELVASGKAAEVKAALKAAGARRVSELKNDQVSVFLEALS